MPARRSSARPRPRTSGFGSATATTTRATPESRTSGAHGGVRPWWAHGSSVTYSVAPRARGPACRSATTSAWGPPARSCQPSPTRGRRGRSRSRRPGWGSSRPARARRASSARRISARRAAARKAHAQAPTSEPANASASNGSRSSGLLADADVADRHAELAHDRDRDAALRRAVELGQHEPGHAAGLRELARLRQPVRAHGRVEHQQRLVRRTRAPRVPPRGPSWRARPSGSSSCAGARRCRRAPRRSPARGPRAARR